MRKVVSLMGENLKYSVIKEPNDHGGNKQRTALAPDMSVRPVNRLRCVYRKNGKAVLGHGNRGRSPANSLAKEINNLIVSLYQGKYRGFSFSHYRDLLEQYEDITVPYASVHRILTNHGCVSPKCRCAARKKPAKLNT